MRIGRLALGGGVGVETVRYYQRAGLMPMPDRPYRGARRYTDADLARLRFIRGAKRLGFSLKEIGALLELSRDDCRNVQQLATIKLGLVRDKITDLQRMEATLAETLKRCRSRQAHAPCPIIETLAHPDGS